jgi:hypothetical protein
MNNLPSSIWQWITERSSVIGIAVTVVVSLAPFLVLAWRNLNLRRKELRDKRFETYHDLIARLVQAKPGQEQKLHTQIAVAYELRNFPEYYELSLRELRSLRQHWSSNAAHQSLIDEMDISIDYISKLAGHRSITRRLLTPRTRREFMRHALLSPQDGENHEQQ